MNNQTIGKMTLKNTGAFVARIQFSYQDAQGNTQYSQPSDNIVVTKSKTIDPGTLGVPHGALISMHAVVVWGKDNTAPETFRYEQGNAIIANYAISGTTLNNSLTLIDVSVPDWKNWSQNIVHDFSDNAENYFYPENRDALQTILRQAQKQGIESIRVSGQRHSQAGLVTEDNRNNPGADQNAWVVDMSCYADLGDDGNTNMVLSGNQVTVNAGVREDALDAFLTKHNKMLKTVTAGGFFSLGGMTSVDVHGATIAAPIFAETTSAFHIMGTDGNVSVINTNTPAQDGWQPIQFARVAFGMLGIVTAVVIEVEDRPCANTLVPCKQTFTLDNETDFIKTFSDLTKQCDRLETFFDPYAGKYLALSWNANKHPDECAPNLTDHCPSACQLADEDEFGAPYEGYLEPIGQWAGQQAQNSGSTTAAGLVVRFAFNEIEKMFDAAVTNHSDLWLTKAARTIFMSYFVELPQLDSAGLHIAWQGLDAVTQRLRSKQDFLLAAPLEFRFIQGGDTALANTYTTKTGSIFINLDMIGFTPDTTGEGYPDTLLQFFADIERAWMQLGGMPHNGKMFGFHDPDGPDGSFTPPFNENYLKKVMVARRQTRVDAFEAYRAQRDPQGLFSNAYTRKLLGTH